MSYGKLAPVPVLVVSDRCSGCVLAKTIIYSLIAEGYLIRVEDMSEHPEVKYVPTLLIGNAQIVGCKTEEEYRRLLHEYRVCQPYISVDPRAILVASEMGPNCEKAKVIINKLIAEGIDIRIVSMHNYVEQYPTFIVNGKHHVGLKTEAEYRRLLQ